MENIVDSFANLCDSYITLADRFQRLDVEHMTLKGKVVPVLKALKTYQQAIATLQAEKESLQQELATTQEECKTLVAKNDALKALEPLLSDEMAALLNSAEEQAALVNETMAEIDANNDPDLSEEEKSLLTVFYNDPERFASLYSQPSSTNNGPSFTTGSVSSSPDPAFV